MIKNKIVGLILLILLIGITAVIALNKTSPPISLPNPQSSKKDVDLPSGYQIGSWLWASPWKLIETQQADKMLDFASEQRINTLYVDISDYLDLYEDDKNSHREILLQTYEADTAEFIQKAHVKNIQVQALAGGPLWANSTHDYIPPLLLKFVTNYNQNHPQAQFSALQLDIEFYNQPNFKPATNQHSQDYLNLVSKLVNQLKTSPLQNKDFSLVFDVPYWFSSEQGVIPSQKWQGQTKPIGFHLIDILEQYPKSLVVIMAYRSQVGGDNGIIEASKPLLNYTATKNTSVIIGVDISPEGGPDALKVENKQDLKQKGLEIINTLEAKPNFKGLAIHHLQSLMQLN
jgi:hypothetical protein